MNKFENGSKTIRFSRDWKLIHLKAVLAGKGLVRVCAFAEIGANECEAFVKSYHLRPRCWHQGSIRNDRVRCAEATEMRLLTSTVLVPCHSAAAMASFWLLLAQGSSGGDDHCVWAAPASVSAWRMALTQLKNSKLKTKSSCSSDGEKKGMGKKMGVSHVSWIWVYVLSHVVWSLVTL